MISNIRDYLSNSINILSYFVLNIECKTVILSGLCLYSRDIHSELLLGKATTNHASFQNQQR